MCYDPFRQKPVSYIQAELEKIWENARSEKPGELNRTKRLAIEDMVRIIEQDGLLDALEKCQPKEIGVLPDSLGRFFGSNEERTDFFIDVLLAACGEAKAHAALSKIAFAIWHSSQAVNGLSGVKKALIAFGQPDLAESRAA